MSPEPDDTTTDDTTADRETTGGSLRLNIGLYAALLVCVAAVVLVGFAMVDRHAADGGKTSGGWLDRAVSVALDRRTPTGESRAGEQLGEDGLITAVPLASEDEQVRSGEVLDSATKMANAFLNLDYENVDSSLEAVRSLATGEFLKQYESSTDGFLTVAKRAKAVQTSEVVWAGIVASDPDSATVLVATTGTISNEVTEFQAVSRTYRLQLELVREDGRWLTSDLQFVT